MAQIQKIRLILFDLDGTLIQSHIDFQTMREQMNLVLRRYNIFDGMRTNAFILERIEYTAQKLGADSSALAELWAIVDEFEEQGMQEAYIEEEVPVILKKLNKTKKLGIITNNSEKVTHNILNRFKIDQYFSIIVCRNDDRRPKPHPDNILFSINRLQLKPQETLYIGDHILDYMAARNANVSFMGYRLFHSNFPKIDSFDQLPYEIEKLEKNSL